MTNIKDILLLQKRELEQKLGEIYVEREISILNLESDIIKVIIGPRRAGKSSFAIRECSQIGPVGYVNFDDEQLVSVKDYDDILNVIRVVYDNPVLFLFDEIQNLPNWELFANRLYRQGLNVIITGSNSNLLSTELSTHLTGRFASIALFPFSFKEFLRGFGGQLTESEIKANLDHYLTYGGFPEPFMKQLDYTDYLTTLFNSILYKDVVKRFKIRYVQILDDLAAYLLANIANEFSANNLSKTLKCSPNTLTKYLGYLEEAFLFFRLSRFSFKVKEQLAFNKKVYCIDNGYIFSRAFRFSPDIGKLYENVVAIELKRHEIQGDVKIYYWKDPPQGEVDFVVKRGLDIEQLIQVCYNLGGNPTKDREVRALLKASEKLQCDDLLVITQELEGEEDVTWYGITRRVSFEPLWKWLLK